MMLIFGIFFFVSKTTQAEEINITDLNAAYNYYSTISGSNAPLDPTDTSKPRSNTPTNPIQITGLGGVASNLYEPVEIVSGFLSSMAIILGMTALFAGFVRYMQHRVNPLAHPIGIVITLLVLGVLLLLLPLVYKLTESGIPFSYG